VATVPVTRTWVAGEVVTSGFMNNNVTGPVAWLLAPAICQVRQIVSQSPATATTTAVTFTAEDVDSTGMHSTSVNTSRLTAVYPGWYLCAGAVSWANNTTGRRVTLFRVNGSDVTASFAAYQPATTSVSIFPSRTMLVFLNVGDYLELGAHQTSGAGLATVVSSSDQSTLTALWASN
jgi:hypothetical protein